MALNLAGAVAFLKPYLPLLQIVVSLLLILLILLQPRGEALGSAFGQSFFSVGKLRGFSRQIFLVTIFLGAVFIILALANLVV